MQEHKKEVKIKHPSSGFQNSCPVKAFIGNNLLVTPLFSQNIFIHFISQSKQLKAPRVTIISKKETDLIDHEIKEMVSKEAISAEEKKSVSF